MTDLSLLFGSRRDDRYAGNTLKVLSVIINADDLGISDEVNGAIYELLGRNQITSASVLANAPRVKQAAASAHCFKRASFGAHLNLTEFEPLTRELVPHLPALRKLGTGKRALQLALKPALLTAVYEEWCCQVKRLYSLGFSISHIDSHQHTHTVPGLFPALKAVQRRFGIRKVRISRNMYSADSKISPVLAMSKRVFNRALKRIYRTRTTDAFTDFVTFCKVATQEENCSYRTIELMVHPSAAGSNEESELLQSEWKASISTAVLLISYLDL